MLPELKCVSKHSGGPLPIHVNDVRGQLYYVVPVCPIWKERTMDQNQARFLVPGVEHVNFLMFILKHINDMIYKSFESAIKAFETSLKKKQNT